MNLSWKIIFWIFTIGLGFVNPVISFVLVLLYYLPEMMPDICKNYNKLNFQEDEKSESFQNQTEMKAFSDDTIEEFR